MAICCVIRPPHHLGGVARSRSLFVATPPLILPRVNHGAGLLRRTAKYASLLRISGALHLALFEQPGKDDFFSSLVYCAKSSFTLIVIPGLTRNPVFLSRIPAGVYPVLDTGRE
jgi:hypothetical protein